MSYPDRPPTSQPIRAGFALTGSFCTFSRAVTALERLVQQGYAITPILSENAGRCDTRFGTAAAWREQLTHITGQPILDTIQATEPIGPHQLFDVLIVAPCTGNTVAKLAHGIVDTPVLMAVKSHLRGEKPVILAVSTNDGLSSSAANIGTLLNRRHYYFVPFRQDAPYTKPRSLVADMALLPETVERALQHQQIQPILLAPLAEPNPSPNTAPHPAPGSGPEPAQ